MSFQKKLYIISASVVLAFYISIVTVWLPVRMSQRQPFSGTKYVNSSSPPVFKCEGSVDGCDISLHECNYDFGTFNMSTCVTFKSDCPLKAYSNEYEISFKPKVDYFAGESLGYIWKPAYIPSQWKCSSKGWQRKMCTYGDLDFPVVDDCADYLYSRPQSFNLFSGIFAVAFVAAHVMLACCIMAITYLMRGPYDWEIDITMGIVITVQQILFVAISFIVYGITKIENFGLNWFLAVLAILLYVSSSIVFGSVLSINKQKSYCACLIGVFISTTLGVTFLTHQSQIYILWMGILFTYGTIYNMILTIIHSVNVHLVTPTEM